MDDKKKKEKPKKKKSIFLTNLVKELDQRGYSLHYDFHKALKYPLHKAN